MNFCCSTLWVFLKSPLRRTGKKYIRDGIKSAYNTKLPENVLVIQDILENTIYLTTSKN